MNYAQAMQRLARREHLGRDEAESLMSELLDGALEPTQTAAILTALAFNGESEDEIAGFAAAMRARARKVHVEGTTVDTCGTGGSGMATLNTSTMAAFVLAADGASVVKHGNRASSGKCGSMDVLERLGVNVELTPEQAQELVGRSPIVFLNARKHHPALGPLGPVRKALGFRTVFNVLGPICNPAGVRRQLLGVSNARYGAVLARTLRALGSERALVVAGADGLDELSLHGPSAAWLLDENGEIHEQSLLAAQTKLAPSGLDELLGGDVDHNAEMFEGILQGRVDGARLQHTALNAGAALWVAGRVDSLAAGVARARDILSSGAAYHALVRYRDLSQSVHVAP